MARQVIPLCGTASSSQALKREAATEASQPWGSSSHQLEEPGDQGEVSSRDVHLGATSRRNLKPWTELAHPCSEDKKRRGLQVEARAHHH